MRGKVALLTAAAALFLAPCMLAAQAPQKGQDEYNPNTWKADDASRIVQQVRHALLTLPNYGVFDSLSFGVQGRKVTLHGYASRPVLKSDAENVVKRIPGVESVDNQVQVLPNSPNDDRIRWGVYQRVYRQPALRKYAGSPVGFGMFPSVARAAGGITMDPPQGFHAIHIIVNRGNVILTGVVNSESDANIAFMQANSTPGTFSVDNDLMIAGKPAQAK